MAVSLIGLTRSPHLVGALVHDEIGEAQALLVVLALATADERLGAGEELCEREGLGDVVVAADAEAGDEVLDLVARR